MLGYREHITCALAAKLGFFPLDRRLRLRRDGWSEGLVQTSARLATTQPSFRMAGETLSRLIRIGIGTTTVWRHHREISRRLEKQLAEEEEGTPHEVWYGDKEQILPQDPVQEHASVSIDGSTILIRDEGYREVKTVSVSEVETVGEGQALPCTQGIGSETRVKARGTEEEPGCQRNIKLGRHSYRCVLGAKSSFAPALKAELERRQVKGVEKITSVNDGAEWIWDLSQAYLPARRVEVLDWPHAMQNLAKAANAAFGEGTAEAQAWLAERETELWTGQRMKVDIALHQLPTRYKERGTAIRQVREYVEAHWPRLRYHRFREEGRPIGSGTVESAAKNVVAWRMKRGGQRWSRSGATRMLAALGEVHSGRWAETAHRLTKAA